MDKDTMDKDTMDTDIPKRRQMAATHMDNAMNSKVVLIKCLNFRIVAWNSVTTATVRIYVFAAGHNV